MTQPTCTNDNVYNEGETAGPQHPRPDLERKNRTCAEPYFLGWTRPIRFQSLHLNNGVCYEVEQESKGTKWREGLPGTPCTLFASFLRYLRKSQANSRPALQVVSFSSRDCGYSVRASHSPARPSSGRAERMRTESSAIFPPCSTTLTHARTDITHFKIRSLTKR